MAPSVRTLAVAGKKLGRKMIRKFIHFTFIYLFDFVDEVGFALQVRKRS